MPDFQTQVNVQPAPAVVGDFASTNPRAFMLAGPGGLVAGPAGATVGLWGWANYPDDLDGAPAQINNFGPGAPAGVLHREMQALITTYLANASLTVPKGFALPGVMTEGDIWVANAGTTQALPGYKAYANNLNGQTVFAPTGQTPVTASITTATMTAMTQAFTGSITDDVLTVSALSSGTLTIGTVLGTAGGVASTTEIVAFGSGTGSVGTYYVNIPEQSVPSSALLTGSATVLNITALASGTIGVGSLISGTGVTGTAVYVRQLGTGTTGSTGTYYTDGPSQNVGAGAFTATNAYETKFYARSSGLAGELVKISSWPIG